MDNWEIISAGLDGLLVIAALMAYLARPRIGGQLAAGMRLLTVGVMILGLAHLIETLLFITMALPRDVNEVVHRLLVGAGFVFVIWGFYKMRRAFDK